MIQIIDKDEYKEILKKRSDRMMVIDYYGKGCSPCKMMEPIMEKSQQLYPQISFYKVDVAELTEEDRNTLGITSVPTFVFSKNQSSYEIKTGAVPPTVFNSYIKKFCLGDE